MHLCHREFIAAIEWDGILDVDVVLEFGRTNIRIKCSLRSVATDDGAIGNDGTCIVADGKVDEFLKRLRDIRICRIDLVTAINEFDGFQMSLGNCACLVAEENVEAPSRLDARYFADEDVVFKHLSHILGGNDGNHERESFRDSHDDDDNRKDNRVNEVISDCHEI